jgi:hypothetical protein
MTEGLRAVLSAWEAFHRAVEEYRELDDERVLVAAESTQSAW